MKKNLFVLVREEKSLTKIITNQVSNKKYKKQAAIMLYNGTCTYIG